MKKKSPRLPESWTCITNDDNYGAFWVKEIADMKKKGMDLDEPARRLIEAAPGLLHAAKVALPGLRYLAEKDPKNYAADLDCLEMEIESATGEKA